MVDGSTTRGEEGLKGWNRVVFSFLLIYKILIRMFIRL